MELFKASNQWQTRPVDERFWSVQEAMKQCRNYYANSFVDECDYQNLRVEASGDDMKLLTDSKAVDEVKISNYAFGQLCQRGAVSAPASYLRKLPPTLAAQNLNFSLKTSKQEKKASLLMQKVNGSNLLRASVSDLYERLWNYEIFDQLQELPRGWRPPPARPAFDDPRARPATEADVLAADTGGMLSIKVGDEIAPAGIYASDHDMFVFLINEDNRIEETLSRGFFLWNSEVGDKSFGYCSFLYNSVCGNHIVWGAQGVIEVRMRHMGEIRSEAFSELQIEMQKYSDSSVSDDQAVIETSKKLTLGASKDQVVAALLGISKKKNIVGINTRTASKAYEIAEQYTDRYGDPNTLWASVNGLTQYSQELPHADTRNNLDRAAGKLLAIAQ